MQLYLLDTNVCVMLLKQRREVWARLRNVGAETCAISEVTVAELLYGAECSQRPEHNRRLVFELTAHFDWRGVRSVLAEYAKAKKHLRITGQMLDEFDIIIAATALEYDLTMVTNNTKHFQRFPGLRLEDWTQLPSAS